MGVQNNYNNYIKRQKQNSTNQFRQKVANSLGGVAVGNNTTKKTPAMMGQTSQNTLGVANAPKSTQPKPITQNSHVQGYTSKSTPYSMAQNIINPNNTQNTLQANIQAQNATPVPQNTQVTPEVTQPITPQVETPVESVEGAEGTGMMSLADINDAVSVDTTNQETSLSASDMQAINELARTPEVQSMAYATKKTTKKKTAQQIAKEILEQQKAQAQKDWELKQAQLQKQKDDTKASHKQSVKDAENAYKKTEEELQLNRYKQQQEMNASAVSRGIQYSPQQLGLQNVADINLNNNITEASTKRNELLNNLQIELNKVLGNLDLGFQEAVNNYNTTVGNLNAEYLNKVADWTYNDEQTEEERKWQDEQRRKDEAFQKKMQEASQKWQSKENALDRKNTKSRSGGGGYSSYSYGGGGYSRGRSFTPYYSNGNYTMRYSNNNDLDLGTDEGAEAYTATAKEYMTDLYNAVDYGGSYDQDARARVYSDEFKNILNQTSKMKNSDRVVKELNKTYDVGIKHLRNKTYARDTNTHYKIGDTAYKPTTPVSKDYIKKKMSTKQLDDANYYSKFSRTEKQKKQAKVNASFHKNAGQGRTLEDLKKFNASKKSTAKKTTVKKSTTTRTNNNKSTFKSKVAKSTANIKSTKRNVKKTTAKKATNTVKRTQSKFQKSFNNLKKNIKKLFGWK